MDAASLECVFSAGVAGIPSDKTPAFTFIQSEGAAVGSGGEGGAEVMMCEIILSRCIYTHCYNCKARKRNCKTWQQ